MYHPLYPESRKCPACGFERIPEQRRVKKGKKWWMIYTCKMCKLQDIEEYIPMKVWDGKAFIDESDQDNET